MNIVFKSIYDAMKRSLFSDGGAKRFSAIRPEKSADDTAKWLCDCVNDGKRDKLSLDQFIWILRAARNMGIHHVMWFLCDVTGYQRPMPYGKKARAEEVKETYTSEIEQIQERQKELNEQTERNISILSELE